MGEPSRKRPAPGEEGGSNLLVQLTAPDGQSVGPQMFVPANATLSQLHVLVNDILANEEPLPYSFYVQDVEVTECLQQTVKELDVTPEEVVRVVYQPQAIFRVRPVTRCASTLPGHAEPVLCVAFSPDSRLLASGSGDTTVRVWDVETNTPLHEMTGHRNWVLAVAFSPHNELLASGSMDNQVRVWNPHTGRPVGNALRGHAKWITSLAWEPYHLNAQNPRLASSSKDSTVRVWDPTSGTCLFSLAGHTASVSVIKWGGEGLLYTASQDRTIKVWDSTQGKLVRSLQGHAHWVNTMALSTDYVLRTGPYDHTGAAPEDLEEAKTKAYNRYKEASASRSERLVSGSDDFTMFLWEPATSKKPLMRMTGHQQLVNQVSFSPDGRHIASASFDKSVKLWDGVTGRFLASLRGHVGAVYQVCWSGDGRLLVSGSKDSTMKVWDVRTHKLKTDLPGHADEVYTVDWSPDGEKVASGSKDRLLRIWHH